MWLRSVLFLYMNGNDLKSFCVNYLDLYLLYLLYFTVQITHQSNLLFSKDSKVTKEQALLILMDTTVNRS